MTKLTEINDEIEKNFKFQLANKLKINPNSWQPSNACKQLLNVSVDCIFLGNKRNIIAEIYCTLGKATVGNKRKIMSDCFKMLAIEKSSNKSFEKYFVTVNDSLFLNSLENTWQYDALKKLNIEFVTFDITQSQRKKLSLAIKVAGDNFRK